MPMTIPRSSSATWPQFLHHPAAMPAAQSTIGMLDDEPETQKSLRRLIGCRGYQVEDYERGEDVLNTLGSHRLDCLLLDLQMEGVNGFEVLETFLAWQVHVPVI